MPILFALILTLGCYLPTAQAQLVNMEETWKGFLTETKTSNISKLVKPEKSQPANYIKYSLMYANSFFCADNLVAAGRNMREVESVGSAVQDKVPGFKERYEGLKIKIKAYHKLVPVWDRFLQDKSSISHEELEQNLDAKTVCEKGTLCKYFYLKSYAYYCEGDLEKARYHFQNRVLKLAATTFDPKSVVGLNEEIESNKKLWAGIDELNLSWDAFINTSISPGFDPDLLPLVACYPIPTMKDYMLRAAADMCNTGAEMLNKIKALEESTSHEVPADLKDKIEWLEGEVGKINNDLAELKNAWESFIPNDELDGSVPYGHVFPCNREAEVQAYIIDGLLAPCKDGLRTLDSITRIRKDHNPSLQNTTKTKLDKLKALVEEEENNVATLNKAWEDFMPDDELSGGINFVFEYCDKIAQTKAFTIDGMLDVCNKGQQRLDDIEKLKAAYSRDLDATTIEKIDKLQAWVDKLKKELNDLTTAWTAFLPNDELESGMEYEHVFICNREAEVQAYVIDGLLNPCKDGPAALENIARIQDAYHPELDNATDTKLKKLQGIVKNENDNIATLNKAWKDFVPDDKLSGGINFVFEYCDKVAQVKAYTIDGTINFCEKSRDRLVDIFKVREAFDPKLDRETIGKIDKLQAAVNKADQEYEQLNEAWTLYIAADVTTSWEAQFPPKDETVRTQISLVNFYCDKIAQTKSWVIKGQLDPCKKGDAYLTKIDALKETNNLSYDEELICQVHRLRSKVYQCKYWALVLEARRITHQERETFGPKSAQIMYKDLNPSNAPCETTVEYEPLGNIGIKYIIAPHLCQKKMMAKMGDPVYYKKIASWVDTEVLSKYCEVSMRCKEDFFIYLEGHTDGYRFNGRSYSESIDIPEGTPYTHFLGQDTLQKTTRNITSSLENNMELGIARAWTVNSQLKFMDVPISIGAYEHPEHEKGGEYRRIDIELNITNLLLDFYEKTLERLFNQSGIGERPAEGC